MNRKERFKILQAEGDQLLAEAFNGNPTPAVIRRLREILRQTRQIEAENRREAEETKARYEAVCRKLRRLERNKEN